MQWMVLISSFFVVPHERATVMLSEQKEGLNCLFAVVLLMLISEVMA